MISTLFYPMPIFSAQPLTDLLSLDVVSFRETCIFYNRAWQWQQSAYVARRMGAIPDTLILLEHCPVITRGRGTPHDSGLLTDPSDLAARKIDVVDVDRGGEVTYHAPGQLIGYPILDLSQRASDQDLHRYLRTLEEVLIQTLAVFGVLADRKPGLTGVWIGEKKIAAMGIKVSRWITLHGFSLNIDLDLTPMRRDIIPCGIVGKEVTSLKELGVNATHVQVEAALVPIFERLLGRSATPLNPDVFLARVGDTSGIIAS